MEQDVELERPEPQAGADVFVSYSRSDRDFVTHLNEALQAGGRSAWIDWQDIPPTEPSG